MKIRVTIVSDPALRWIMVALALCAFDLLGWRFWPGVWHQGLHGLTLYALAFVGFKISYELGRGDRKREQVTLRIDKHYRIPGPDAVYTITGLSTWHDMDTHHAEVTFIDQETWARRRG